MKTKILLTGGGTAGHIWPIIAVTDILKKTPEVDFLYVGSRQGLEKKIALGHHVKFKGLFVGKWRNYFSLSNIWDLFKTFIGVVQALFLIITYRPDIVFAKGGYVTFPILFWTRLFKIPLVIHESDIIPGKANRWAESFAQKVCVGYPQDNYKNFSQKKIVYTGTPIRSEFLVTSDRIRTHSRPNILVTGGSQGSSAINLMVKEILPKLLEKYEVYHLLGDRDDNQSFEKNNNQNYHPIGFSSEMPSLMKQADLIISRAGANTLTEIAALSKSSILIPYSAAAGDHQTCNAQVFTQNNAAIVIAEKDLTSEKMLSIINQLMNDEKERSNLGENAHKLYQKDSAQKIVNILLEEVK